MSKTCHTLPKGMAEVKNTISWVINAWDVPTHQVGPTFDVLMQKGLQSFVTFVPWQGVENDISRAFTRFLQHAYERRLDVKMVVTPELGMTFPWCGVPKELATDPAHQSMSKRHGPISVITPNVNFNLPTFFSSEVRERYFGFLVRLESLLKDFCEINPGAAHHFTISVGGSFFKYYRSAVASSYQDYGSEAGDYSLAAQAEFKKYQDKKPKTRASEPAQYRSFHRYFEDLFRTKAAQIFQKRNPGWTVEQLEIFTPELDPALAMENFWAHAMKKPLDLFKFSKYLTSSFSRIGRNNGKKSTPVLLWSNAGDYGQNAPARTQNGFFQSFMNSLLSQGEVWLSVEAWFSFSDSFRDRLQSLEKQSKESEWKSKDSIYILTSHLWSTEKSIQLILEQLSTLGWKQGVRFVQDLSEIPDNDRSFFILIDPDFEINQQLSTELLSKMRKSHSVWFMAESSLADPSLATHKHAIHLDQGVPCRIIPIENAKWVVYRQTESVMAFNHLITQISNLLGESPYLKSSDANIRSISCDAKMGEQIHFFFNPSDRACSIKVEFPKARRVGQFSGAVMPLELNGLAAVTFTSERLENTKEINGTTKRLENI